MRLEKSRLAASIAALFIGVSALPAVHAHVGDKLGKVEFKVDCNAAAQQEFNTAMAYYHSFAWDLVSRPLNRVLEADPSCGMAYWLRSLSLLDNPFTWPVALSPKVMADGQAAIDSARKAGLKSQRERDYVDALAVFYKDHDKINHRTRVKALEDAMQQVAQRYPQDVEATILYSLVLSVNFEPTDMKFTNQLRATQQLEPIFIKQPDHPGVAHYLIHSYDYPPLAQYGLEAAKRYAKIAPDAAHANHMPSHIFTRIGYWRDSIEANRASAKIDADRTPNSPHAYDYMVYAHLQLGQDAAARQVVAHAQRVEKKVDNFAAAYAYAAMPARIAIERGQWKEAANLPLEPAADKYPWKKYPQAEAISVFARGIGAAMSGDAAAATTEVKRLHALRDAASGMKLAYWAEQIDIQAELVRGVAHCAEGKHKEAISILRAAADREDKTQKHVVSPGLIMPARELLAKIIFDWANPADALREYETVLDKEPNRLRAYSGAAQSAQRTGDMKKAAYYHARVFELMDAADAPRSEIAAAKRFFGM